MNLEYMMREYLRISDIMYQAIRVGSIDIFENALTERGRLVEDFQKADVDLDSLDISIKTEWKSKVETIEAQIEVEMEKHKSTLQSGLDDLNTKRAKLRKHSNVKNYYGRIQSNQGKFINKLR